MCMIGGQLFPLDTLSATMHTAARLMTESNSGPSTTNTTTQFDS